MRILNAIISWTEKKYQATFQVPSYDYCKTMMKEHISEFNLSLGFQTKRDSNQSPQLQRLARKSKICW